MKSFVSAVSEIIVVGDSVAFGYGLEPGESWPSVLFEQLKEKKIQVSVRNRAVSGNGTMEMERERHTIEKVSKLNKRPLVLVMMGHNDFIGHGWRSWASQGNGTSVPSINTNPPRIYRIVRWMNKLLRSQSDGVVNWQNSEIENQVQKNIQKLSTYTEKMGGKMFLMTYLVPGKATEKLSPSNQESLEKARKYQIQGNKVLRKIAARSDIGLIDIEDTVDVPPEWDSSWWIDHIHPRQIGHVQIATSTRKHLSAFGEIPLR